MNKRSVSVVMPTFNEEQAVEQVIDDIHDNLKGFDVEVVIVDSSKDRTPELAAAKGARVIDQEPQGHGVALRAAIQNASNEIVLTADCDNTYPMEFLKPLVEMLEDDGLDLISCNRLTKQLGKEMPAANRLANWGFAFMVRVFYGISVHDVSTGMFCIRKSAFDRIVWETNFAFPCELIVRSAQAGHKIKEIDIPYRIRVGEVTLHRWRSGKAYVSCILNYKLGFNITRVT